MGRLGCAGVVVAAVYLCAPAGARAQEGKDDALVGEWDIVRMVYKGEVQEFGGPTGGTIKIGDAKLGLRYLGDKDPSEFHMTVRPARAPREIDIRLDGFEQVWLGIYEVKDGTLRIIFAYAGDDRPKSFEAAGKERLTLYALKKAKK